MEFDGAHHSPEITRINGHQVVKAPEGLYKVISDDGQIGNDFATFEQAASFARSLRSKDPRNP